MTAKRSFDIVVAGLGLLILSPLLLALSLWIRLDSPGPVLYRAPRVGRGGRPFSMLKFRSMAVGSDRGPSSTPDGDPRITRAGRFLRSLKLDEFPQLINVVRGEMSLVGPRPQIQWVVDSYSEKDRRILDVRPGITDLASLRFHNEGELLAGATNPDRVYLETIHPEKMRLSIQYVESRTFWLDLTIIAKTVFRIYG